MPKRANANMDDKGPDYADTKDKSKGRDASNYRPIACLPLCWKLLTALLSDIRLNLLVSGREPIST